MASAARLTSLRRFGPFELNAATGELRKSGILLKIHPQPFRVLQLLVEHAGKVVTREEIARCLWNGNSLVDSDGGINFCVKQIRAVLSDDAEKPRYIETLSRRGYRFIAAVSQESAKDQVIYFRETRPQPNSTEDSALAFQPEPGCPARAASAPIVVDPVVQGRRKLVATGLVAIAIVAVLLATGFGVYIALLLRRPPKLTEKDTLVLADFENTTGDAVFDGALKQALTAELGQSPFLNLLPDRRVSETLRMMNRSSGERVTKEVGREICLRTGSKVLLAGNISRLDTHYLLSLNALACSNGAILASEQVTAVGKEDVLRALSSSTASLRRKLGESLPSVQKYDVPIEATTTSLDALQNLSLAARVGASEGDAASIPFVERALQYDPHFVLAYAALARRYINLNQPALALANAAKAYELRDHVTEREWLQISMIYFRAHQDFENLNKTLELWKVDYPRDAAPHGSLCINHEFIGQFEQALVECQEALRLDPDRITNYDNLAAIFLDLNRFQEAQQTCDAALVRGLSCFELYDLYFLRGDSTGMAKELSAAAGKPGVEDGLFFAQAKTEAYYGRLRSAQDFSRKASDSATRAGLWETAALWRVSAALTEAEFGEAEEARRDVAEALRLASNRNARILGAVALARIGATSQARELVKELQLSEPSNTLLKTYWLPVIESAIELHEGRLTDTFATLQVVAPYELAHPSPDEIGTLYPVYLKGNAFLAACNGAEAAAAFRKVLDHPGISVNFPTGALARLSLARAYALQGDTSKARAAYEDFLSLWKDADPDIPILKQAQAEHARLGAGFRVGNSLDQPFLCVNH